MIKLTDIHWLYGLLQKRCKSRIREIIEWWRGGAPRIRFGRIGASEIRPPTEFVRKLRTYDPDLRVVWSLVSEQWLIERQVRRARIGYGFESHDPDVQRRARDGFVHVGNVPPWGLDELVLLNLWKSDMWRQGGAKAVNAMLDEYWESKERKDDKTERDDLRQVAADMYDRIAWLRKGRVSVPEAVA